MSLADFGGRWTTPTFQLNHQFHHVIWGAPDPFGALGIFT